MQWHASPFVKKILVIFFVKLPMSALFLSVIHSNFLAGVLCDIFIIKQPIERQTELRFKRWDRSNQLSEKKKPYEILNNLWPMSTIARLRRNWGDIFGILL